MRAKALVVLPGGFGSFDELCGLLPADDYLFPSRIHRSAHLGALGSTRESAIRESEIGLDSVAYGTHSMRRTKASLIYRRTRNLRAVQLLLGHTNLESTVRHLGIEVEDALELAEQTEVWHCKRRGSIRKERELDPAHIVGTRPFSYCECLRPIVGGRPCNRAFRLRATPPGARAGTGEAHSSDARFIRYCGQGVSSSISSSRYTRR
jgi:hypothetical protein